MSWIILALIGSLLLRGIFVREAARSRWVVPLFVASLLACSGLTSVALRHLGFVPNTDAFRVTHKALVTLRECLSNRGMETIVFVDGGSYGSRGVDGARFGRHLALKVGKPVGVVQLTMAGANHFERHAIMEALFANLTSSELKDLKKRQVVLFLEINQGYDANPLSQVNERNLFSGRLYGYLTPVNTWYAVSATREVNGRMDWYQSGALSAHALMSFFNVGVRDRMVDIEDVGVRPGYVPLRSANKRFVFKSIMHVLSEAEAARPPRQDWVDTIRTPRLVAAMRGSVDRVAYYAPPNSSASYLAYAKAFCGSHPSSTCIDYGDAKLLRSIDRKSFWYDKSHLLASGANRYTEWLAEKIGPELLQGAAP